jgi:purine-nucleoside phosphorylase
LDKNIISILKDSTDYIRSITKREFDIAIVLGSGLGNLSDDLSETIEIPYENIPHFPVATAPGHTGTLIAGYLGGKSILCFKGRFHFYEGYSMETIVYPELLMGALKIKNLILTNASGCLEKDWNVGDLMIIKDHIKLCAENPMIGYNEEMLGNRFFDMSDTYNEKLREYAKKCAKKINLPIREGIYQYFSGPCFETAAEVMMAKSLGSSAAGMSTVPDAITAHYLGMNILGISCLTNYGTGISQEKLTADDVMIASAKAKDGFILLLKEIMTEWPLDDNI